MVNQPNIVVVVRSSNQKRWQHQRTGRLVPIRFYRDNVQEGPRAQRDDTEKRNPLSLSEEEMRFK